MVRPPPRERVSRAAAEGRRAECVCEAESELESVGVGQGVVEALKYRSC